MPMQPIGREVCCPGCGKLLAKRANGRWRTVCDRCNEHVSVNAKHGRLLAILTPKADATRANDAVNVGEPGDNPPAQA